MRLRNNVDYTIETLTRLAAELEDCRSGNDLMDGQDRWLRWWSGADRQCQSLFGDGEMVASLYASSQRVRQMSGVLPYGC
jgi:hypothetical protein